MDEDTRQVAEWASRVAWRSTGTVVVAGDLKCKYWEIFRQYNPMVKIIRFDPTGPAFDEEKKAEVLCCTTEHDLSVMVASNYKVPMRVEVIGSEEARASHGDALAGIVDSAVRTCVEAEHTTRVNAERWTRLGLEALCQMAGRTALNGMTQCLAGRTAVIVGAGPSLDKNVGVLKKYQDRCAIFAVDAAVEPMRKAGIQPHFVVTVDAGDAPVKTTWQSPVWRGAVVIPGVHVSEWTWKLKPRRWLWGVQMVGAIGPFVACTLELPVLRSGGSVSTIAFSAAKGMGADKIVLVGMDSSYAPGRKFYASGVPWKYVDREGVEPIAKVEAYGGIGYVDAPRTLCAYREWFEGRSCEAAAAGAPVVNATEGGARIAGAVEATLEDTLGKLPVYDLWPDILAAVDGAPVIDPVPIIEALRTEVDNAVVAAAAAGQAADALRLAHKSVSDMLEAPRANLLNRAGVGPIQELGLMPRGPELIAGAAMLGRLAETQKTLAPAICGTIKRLEETHARRA